MEQYGFMLSKEKSNQVIFAEQYEKLITNPRFIGTFVINDMPDKKRRMMWMDKQKWLNENYLESELNTECVMLLFKKN